MGPDVDVSEDELGLYREWIENNRELEDPSQGTLDLLRMARAKLREHLGLEVPWDELLNQAQRHGGPRLSSYIQEPRQQNLWVSSGSGRLPSA